MKRLALSLLVLLPWIANAQTPLTQWKMQRQGDNRSYNVTVPTTVAGALNEAGAFGADVLDEDRYLSIDKTQFDSPWVFSTRFDAPKGLRHVLRFEGLDYSADIRLNGKLIASADTTYGVFCVWEFDVTALAKKRNNNLEVTVYKAPKQCLNSGFADWNPHPVDESMGIIRKVELISTPDVEVQDVFVIPEVNPADLSKAGFKAVTTLVNRSDKPVQGVLEGTYDGGGAFSESVSLAPGETREVTVARNVENPRIWWTHDMGKPELYTLSVGFRSGKEASHARTVRFGLRSVSSEVDDRGHRQLYLNGQKILFKAGGWSDDIFMQDTPARTRAQLLYVKDMGLNGVRFENIWGRDDTVYDLCDELGLVSIVGFSCHWEWEDYCGLPEVKGYGCINGQPWEDLAVRYFRDQVIRLHNHPSILAWLTGSDRIPNPGLEERYLADYKHYDYRPYICSAKSLTSLAGPSGVKMEGPYEYVAPDYWYRDEKHGGAFGFNTETGIGMNIPQKESVVRMVGKEHAWPIDKNWDYHCTASESNMNTPGKMVEVMTAQYGEATDLDDFMRKAHAIDYDGTRAMFEAFRYRIRKTTGIVQWMQNSAWPSFYWQFYDWYMVPTAGYYGTKKACAPYQVVYHHEKHAVYTVNEVAPEKRFNVQLSVFGPDGKLIRTDEKRVSFKQRDPQKIFTDLEGPGFIALTIRDDGGNRIADNFYCLPEGTNEYNWKKTNWVHTPITSYASLQFVSALPKAVLTMKTRPAEGGYEVTLRNTSDVLAYQNILKAKDADGNLIPAVIWSDNFLTLAPGESRKVRCRLPEGSPSAAIFFEGWNGEISQAPDSLDRNRSRYATYDFSKDDHYSVSDTYDPVSVQSPKGKKVKNVIFLIGDGMGFEHISCAWVVNGGHLNMDQMPVTGASRTYAVDRLVTDSCAGGAALAAGQKTKYGYIGVDPDANPMQTALTDAQAKGMKTGLTVTCRINDATPADFYCHATSRKDEEGISAQYVNSGIDFISGGGLHFWTDRSDGRNLVEEMKAKGYTFVDKLDDIQNAQGSKFLGLYGDYDLDPVSERGPILPTSAMKAIQMLDNPKGFFLMIEGSQIDDWAHRNKIGYCMEELFDFDRTLGAVLEWAARDGETLVVVTADHNTGGLTLLQGSLEEHLVKVHFSTKGHNGILVPVFAFGPRSEEFMGVHENAEVGQIIRRIIQEKK